MTERCCPPGQCARSAGNVAWARAHIRACRAAGEDPSAVLVLARAGDDIGRSSAGVSTSLDIRQQGLIWDVERAQAAGAVTTDEICRLLCPWALEE